MKPYLNLAIAFASLFFFSCRQSSYVTPGGNGRVNIVFSNNAGSNSLTLGQTYTNQHGDQFTVNMFKYYISSIKLNGSGTSYTDTGISSYHLIDQNSPAGSSFQLTGLQYGQYTSITFTVGVDSLHNVVGPHTGALDPVNNMFGSSGSGYTMLKMEGTSPQSVATGHSIVFHADGFWGPNTALRTITVGFPNPISVTGDVTAVSHVNVAADVIALFKSPNVFDFSVSSSIITPGAEVTKLADNYANMFKVVSSGM